MITKPPKTGPDHNGTASLQPPDIGPDPDSPDSPDSDSPDSDSTGAGNVGETAPHDDIARVPPVAVPGGFQAGNQLWRRRKPPGLQASRRSLREALHSVLTPDKMADCVRKMLDIIGSSDKKAAVQAFKVLSEAAGIRSDADSQRSGPSFTFILPGPGAIPERSPDIVAESDAGPALESG